jgi:hypothetical protein
MVSDAARAWVSPYWEKSYGHVETTISLLNPGFWSANVKVIFHWKGGNVLAANQETIPPESIAMFEPPEAPEADGYGWVSIVSDSPVLPWGHIKYGGGQDGRRDERADDVRPLGMGAPCARALPASLKPPALGAAPRCRLNNVWGLSGDSNDGIARIQAEIVNVWGVVRARVGEWREVASLRCFWASPPSLCGAVSERLGTLWGPRAAGYEPNSA